VEAGIITVILGLGSFVLWILYWVKISGYRKMLVADSLKNSSLQS
jgi:hypothetical protein